jgi:hypothetical protein
MKALLMYRDRDFEFRGRFSPNGWYGRGNRPFPEVDAALPAHAADLIQDLELDTLFNAMSRNDPFLFAIAKQAVVGGLNDPDSISYRQAILRDCLVHPDIVRGVYDLAAETIQRNNKIWRGTYSATAILSSAVEVMRMLVEMLKRLRSIADEHADQFRSEGFVRFFTMLKAELNDEYFATVEGHLRQLKFGSGELISAQLGKGNKGIRYILRKPWPDTRSWMKRILGKGPPAYSYEIAPRDEAGSQALGELVDRGANLVANALAQSADHVLSFFHMLLAELGFYVGCLNLQERLAEKGEPTCIPVALGVDESAFSAEGLYDVCLTLHVGDRVVGNDVAADGKELVVITGANQGGKSTFLRSVGLSHLMMQCGMFVPAVRFSANVCNGVFTHYKREEDVSMKSGKFDEELNRMSTIIDRIQPRSLMLCNESFASTNEREGSEIGRQIVRAMLGAHIKVVYVTHMFDLANGFRRQNVGNTLFLRAEREPDGRRTFRLIEGEPQSTSYGPDLYREMFRPVTSESSVVSSSAITADG